MMTRRRNLRFALLALALTAAAEASRLHTPSRSALHASAVRTPLRRAAVVAADDGGDVPGRASFASLDGRRTAAYLAAEVKEYLDREWMVQDCHAAIADVCAQTFSAAHASGEGLDASSMLMRIADALLTPEDPMLFDEAFVGPFDVANLCSDLLMHRVGAGADCACNVAPTGVGDVAAAAIVDDD